MPTSQGDHNISINAALNKIFNVTLFLPAWFPAVYLHAPEASELLCCGEVRAAHALPQPVRVAHVVVDAIRDVHETWRADGQIRDGPGLKPIARTETGPLDDPVNVPARAASPLSETVTSSAPVDVLLSSLL